jgi:hypothetical protein
MNTVVKKGMKFGRLTVIGFSERRKSGNYFKSICDCGKEVICRKDALYTGKQRSCGCLLKELSGARLRTHGLRNTPEYEAWAHMLRRCYTPTTKHFDNYGGRGITVCDRWRHSFENFLADMGFRPSSKHSLDRINNDGNYEPSNCRWATFIQQCNNTRRNFLITYKGETLTETQWRKKLGFNRGVIIFRIKNGWSAEDALTIPPGTTRKYTKFISKSSATRPKSFARGNGRNC